MVYTTCQEGASEGIKANKGETMIYGRAKKRGNILITDIQVGNRHYGKIKRIKAKRKEWKPDF